MDHRLSAVLPIETDQRINLEVCKVQVNVDSVQADDKVDEGVLLRGGHSMQEGGGDGRACGEGFADWDREDGCLCIYVADVDAAFMREEDPVTLTSGGNANIVFGM